MYNCAYFVVRDSQESFYVRRVFSEEKPEKTRSIRSHDASLRRFSSLQIWYKLKMKYYNSEYNIPIGILYIKRVLRNVLTT